MQNHDDLDIPTFLKRGAAAQAAVNEAIAQAPVVDAPIEPTAATVVNIAARDGNPNWKELAALRDELDKILRGPLPVGVRRKKANQIRRDIKKLAGKQEVQEVSTKKKTKHTKGSSSHTLSIDDLKLKPEAKAALKARADRTPHDDRARTLAKNAAKAAAKTTPAEGSSNDKVLKAISRKEGATMVEACKALKLDPKEQRARERVRAIVYHLRTRLNYAIEHDGERYRRSSK